MNRLVLAGAVAIALGGKVANAADLLVKAPPPILPVFTWAGPYLTGIVDYSWGRSRNTFSETQALGTNELLSTADYSNSVHGASFGVGGGWRTQLSTSLVTGTEADIEYCGERGTGSVLSTAALNGGGTQPYTATTTTKCRWMSTMTMMVGVPVPQGTPDTHKPGIESRQPNPYRGQTLLYLKGGLALVDLATNGTGQAVNLQTTILNAPFTINGSSIRPGLAVVGGGGEMMLSRNWEFRLEYLYTYFGSF
ncbi:MAG TPA: hypothetical protein VEI98_10105, partial [Xanthobacteraceae bacterium]|nr:hypothetical protein [Xanthobacteraceae bacterium]